MDIATVVGLLGAFAMVLLGILNGGSLDKFVDATSIFIVVGGGLMVMMMRSTLADFLKLGGIIGKAFGAKVDDPVDLINQLVELGTLARKDGMIALEGQEISNQFLAKGIGMLVDGTDAPGPALATKQSAFDMFQTGHRQGINRERHAEFRRQAQNMGNRGADCAAVTDGNNVFAGVIDRIAVDDVCRAGDQIGEALATGRRVAGRFTPELEIGVRVGGLHVLPTRALPFAEILFA